MATAITYNEIQALYLGLLDRPADAPGEAFWYDSGTASSSSVAQGIGNFANYYPSDNGLSGVAISSSNINGEITNLYTNMLGVTPSSSGLAYWAGAFNTDVTQGMTAGAAIGSIADQIFNIVENLPAGSPYINDKTTMDDRIATAAAYTQANANVPYSSSAYLAEGHTIITTPLLTTFTLTTGAIDSIAPVGNSVINGALTSNLSTSSVYPFDTINATGSNNTFDVVVQGSYVPPSSAAGTFPALTISGVQTTNIESMVGVAVGTSSWTGLTALNLTASDGTDNITAAGTTAVAVTDTLTSGNSTSADTITINGGSTVTLNTTDSSSWNRALLGNITIGSSSAPTGAVTVNATDTITGWSSHASNISIGSSSLATTGAVTVNATDTITNSSASATNITVYSGGAVTIDSTVNTNQYFSTGYIWVAAAVGNVTINDATNNTSTSFSGNIWADQVYVSSGATVTVNETVSTPPAATRVATIHEGTVYVSSKATTSVTVNQAPAATGHSSKAAVAAVTGVSFVQGETAQPGITAVTGVTAVTAKPAAAAVTATPTVVDADVYIWDENYGVGKSTSSNTITTVSLDNYGYSYFTGNALTKLTLGGTGGGLDITNGATGTGLTNTTLNLTLNTLTDNTGITDRNNEIKTLNVTTEGGNSTLNSFIDTGLTTLNVSGSDVLTLTTVPSSITALTVTGGAGFNGDIHLTHVTAFDPTSTGVITTTLNDTTQSFTGGAGQDIVTITADATKAITGGTATDNEIILKGAAATFTAANTGTNVTNFATLGVYDTTPTDVNVYDMKNVFTGYTGIDVVGAVSSATSAGSTSFINAATGTTLAIDSSIGNTTGGTLHLVEANINDPAHSPVNVGTLLYQVNDATGAADTLNMSLGTATTTGIIVGGGSSTLGLVLEDANAVGIGTLDVTSNGVIGKTNTIRVLTDDGLSHLNVSGADGLTINYLDEYTTQATAFALNNTSAGTVTITDLWDANLGSLTVAGTGQSAVGILFDSGHVLSITDNGSDSFTVGTILDLAALSSLTLTGAVTVGALFDMAGTSLTIANGGLSAVTVGNVASNAFVDSVMTSLTLTGNVAFGIDTVTAGVPVAMSATGAATGVTVSAGTDNAHINLNLTGAGAGATDSITVGNGNDYITDGSTAGTVNVTVGTGSNLIDLHTGSAGTYSATVTLGAGSDHINVGVVAAGAITPNTVITGAVAGDLIGILNGIAFTALTAAQQATVTAESGLGGAVAYVDGATVGLGAATATDFTYGGNTYVLETVAGGAANAGTMAAGNTLIELVGVHSLSTTMPATHVYALAS